MTSAMQVSRSWNGSSTLPRMAPGMSSSVQLVDLAAVEAALREKTGKLMTVVTPPDEREELLDSLDSALISQAETKSRAVDRADPRYFREATVLIKDQYDDYSTTTDSTAKHTPFVPPSSATRSRPDRPSASVPSSPISSTRKALHKKRSQERFCPPSRPVDFAKPSTRTCPPSPSANLHKTLLSEKRGQSPCTSRGDTFSHFSDDSSDEEDHKSPSMIRAIKKKTSLPSLIGGRVHRSKPPSNSLSLHESPSDYGKSSLARSNSTRRKPPSHLLLLDHGPSSEFSLVPSPKSFTSGKHGFASATSSDSNSTSSGSLTTTSDLTPRGSSLSLHGSTFDDSVEWAMKSSDFVTSRDSRSSASASATERSPFANEDAQIAFDGPHALVRANPAVMQRSISSNGTVGPLPPKPILSSSSECRKDPWECLPNSAPLFATSPWFNCLQRDNHDHSLFALRPRKAPPIPGGAPMPARPARPAAPLSARSSASSSPNQRHELLLPNALRNCHHTRSSKTTRSGSTPSSAHTLRQASTHPFSRSEEALSSPLHLSSDPPVPSVSSTIDHVSHPSAIDKALPQPPSFLRMDSHESARSPVFEDSPSSSPSGSPRLGGVLPVRSELPVIPHRGVSRKGLQADVLAASSKAPLTAKSALRVPARCLSNDLRGPRAIRSFSLPYIKDQPRALPSRPPPPSYTPPAPPAKQCELEEFLGASTDSTTSSPSRPESPLLPPTAIHIPLPPPRDSSALLCHVARGV
ncbi:hypothetical protein IE81DRAFT_341292 [Ceraceosorus guamensis]|uniref:Uncharacterized protein n=1 Tax=Ceraceosorus guamensis TaxID=1522189 RepID=A0A316VY09_9BASI|nr:hypothetical protein IE81DRAFT_341292 [Ceraceosorus guamensis]PWN42547.1 hypothetical protein IE81DRAFT_341292 [Ceraceosorus guamensis]